MALIDEHTLIARIDLSGGGAQLRVHVVALVALIKTVIVVQFYIPRINVEPIEVRERLHHHKIG